MGCANTIPAAGKPSFCRNARKYTTVTMDGVESIFHNENKPRDQDIKRLVQKHITDTQLKKRRENAKAVKQKKSKAEKDDPIELPECWVIQGGPGLRSGRVCLQTWLQKPAIQEGQNLTIMQTYRRLSDTETIISHRSSTDVSVTVHHDELPVRSRKITILSIHSM